MPAGLNDVPLFFVVRSDNVAGWVIRWATRSKWNHAGLIGRNNERLGAHPGGFGAEQQSRNEHVVYARITAAQQSAIWDEAERLIGTPYGWLDILCIGLLQYGVRPKVIRDRVQRSDQLICSQAVDFCVQVADLHFFEDKRLPQDVTPGDLVNLGALAVGVYLRE